MFHPVSLVPVRGVIVVCCLFCGHVCSSSDVLFSCNHCCPPVLKKKKKKNALSASLVVVTMGSLHMVSERVQPATWDHYGFR
jgi:hypothetical protein